MTQRREGQDLLEQLGDELKLQAWLGGAEIRNPSLAEKAVRDEVDLLVRVRDELRLQLHLGKLEAKDEFHRLEDRWQHVKAAAAETATGAAQSVRELLQEIRDGYRKLRGRELEQDEEPTPA